MNDRLNSFKSHIKNKKIAVLGIGVSNTPLINFLSRMDAQITAFDKEDEENIISVLQRFQNLKIEFSLGKNYLKNLKGFDLIFKTPGMRPDIPEIREAVKEGAELTSEMEVFFKLCPAQIFGVTGSDGKTTTTTLIYEILKEEGYKCWLGGNIGTPLLDRVEEIKSSDKIVLELSSFQLLTMKKSPDVAVITNITPNHLDIHNSMEEYIDAKKNIFRFQDTTSDTGNVVLNYDNDIAREFCKEAISKVTYFSRLNTFQNGAYLKGGYLIYNKDGKEVSIMRKDEILIPGMHNVENYLAASAAVIDYVSPETIKRIGMNFKGVEHRIELTREINGIKFYNDSIGTSPARTIAGLNSFDKRVILIAGGYDKKIPYDVMGKAMLEKIKSLVLIGQTADKIEAVLRDEIMRSKAEENIPVIECLSLEEAVKFSYDYASSGDVVLFSPASASFDMFKNFEERGNKFKELVNGL